jgi:hypothetical protein
LFVVVVALSRLGGQLAEVIKQASEWATERASPMQQETIRNATSRKADDGVYCFLELFEEKWR